jgi:hypothetical protein
VHLAIQPHGSEGLIRSRSINSTMKFTCYRLNLKNGLIQEHLDPLMVLKSVLSQALKPDDI